MSNLCDVLANMARQRLEDICWISAEVLSFSQSLPEFGANDSSAFGGSSGSSNHGNASAVRVTLLLNVWLFADE